MTEDRDGLVDELQEAGEHPCRANLPFGLLLRQGATRIRELEAQLAEAREALEKARDTFRLYQVIHSGKNTGEGQAKARKNGALADRMDRTLAKLTGDHRAVRGDG